MDQAAAKCKEAHFTGVDLCPPRRPSDALGPPRVNFEIYDINAGLEPFYDAYDVVHARNLSQGVRCVSLSYLTPLLIRRYDVRYYSF